MDNQYVKSTMKDLLDNQDIYFMTSWVGAAGKLTFQGHENHHLHTVVQLEHCVSDAWTKSVIQRAQSCQRLKTKVNFYNCYMPVDMYHPLPHCRRTTPAVNVNLAISRERSIMIFVLTEHMFEVLKRKVGTGLKVLSYYLNAEGYNASTLIGNQLK